MAKRQFTATDLQVGQTATFHTSGPITTHTHQVHFGRPLTRAEQHLFIDVLTGFYHTVHFSRQFGSTLVAEPVIEFVSAAEARYTLRQTSLDGAWKDLLFAILANFSQEIAPIRRHDDSQAFDSVYVQQLA